MQGGTPAVIPGEDGSPIVPSVVAFDQDTQAGFSVGNAARNVLLTNSANAVYSVKRLMGRDLADVEGVRVIESYFDAAIRPRPPRGVLLFAPCSFNSLNKLAHGIADNLALSVTAEAIGRGTPVLVGLSLNQALLDHPQAQASIKTLSGWQVTVVPPVDEGEGPRLAPTTNLLDLVRPFAPG